MPGRSSNEADRQSSQTTTWDGRARAMEPPFGASVIVHRTGEAGREFLLLHRAHHGAEYEGDWAWTPPAGARLPGESIEACAARELAEEAGLTVPIRAVPAVGADWMLFEAEIDRQVQVVLHDAEHDRFAWVTLEEAVDRCLPATVGEAFRRVAPLVDAGGPRRRGGGG
jgi:8-oxo-dGTP pyrophosphatase MutT (NUDIX family)